MYIIEIQQCIIIIIISYHFMSFKEIKRRKESKCIFIESVILTLFTFSCSLHLFLWIWATIWCYLLTPIQFCYHLPPLCCYCQIHYMTLCYGPNNTIIYILFCMIAFIKRRKGNKYVFQFSLIITYIITFIDALRFFCVESNYSLGSLAFSSNNFP